MGRKRRERKGRREERDRGKWRKGRRKGIINQLGCA